MMTPRIDGKREFGSRLRHRSERLLSIRSAMRATGFGIVASFVMLHVEGPEVLVILVPEVFAYILAARARRYLVAYRRLRIALLLEDGLGRRIDPHSIDDVLHDLPQIEYGGPPTTPTTPYYSSQSAAGVVRLLENLHESAFFWAWLLRARKRATGVLVTAGILAFGAALMAIYYPNIASTLLSGAALIIATVFVSDAIAEYNDVAVFHREFVDLERAIATARREKSSSTDDVMWFLARYSGLAQAAPLIPDKLYESMNPQLSTDWSARNT